MAHPMSPLDHTQTLKTSFNDADGTLKVTGFVSGKIGHKITVGYPDAVTETYTFIDNGTTLYVLTAIYTDSTKNNLMSVERTS
jgi:hypothetical protein